MSQLVELAMCSGRTNPEQSQWPEGFEEYLNMNPGQSYDKPAGLSHFLCSADLRFDLTIYINELTISRETTRRVNLEWKSLQSEL